VNNYAELAPVQVFSMSRVSQILKLRNLAPAIQQKLLYLDSGGAFLSELHLRRIFEEMNWQRQLEQFDELVAKSHKV